MKRRFASFAAVLAVAFVGAVAGAFARPPASHLHSGEYCTKRYQGWYHEHGYTCKRASDGKLRLFSW